MENLDVQIGIVHASIDLITEAKRVAAVKNYHLCIEPFCLEGAILAGRRLEKRGIDVIVSRRATAEVLRENLNVPIFSIPLTFFDIFQNIWRASKKWDVILFPVYSGRSDRMNELKEMIDADILFYECNHSGQLEEAVAWGKSKGCKVAVGGPIIKNFAKKYGIECEEIKTNPDSIQSTLENAYWTAVNRKKEKARIRRYKVMLDMSKKAMIALDNDGFIRTTNALAKKILKLPEKNKQNQHIKKYLPSRHVLNCIDSGNPCEFHLEMIGSKQYIIEFKPLKLNGSIIGGIVTCQDPDKVIATESEIRRSRTKRLVAKYTLDDFIHNGTEIRRLVDNVKKFSITDSTVLIVGATGTGKEIIAHSIHYLSERRTGPLVSINCASIPEQILESELFGYEEGSFTGARRGGKPGLFELAHKGTIFLDEVGSMPMSLQSRLLRVLQEREVMRIGGDRLIPIDVRIVAATNEDLKQAVIDGRFREDLFFRLNVLNIHIPPLNERVADIPLLVKKLTNRISSENSLPPIRFSESDIKRISSLGWPGNVRELIAFLERIIILCGGRFSRKVFEEQFAEIQNFSKMKNDSNSLSVLPSSKSLKQNVSLTEADYLTHILQKCKYSKGLAAKELGISRTTLWRKMKVLGIEA